MTEHPVLKVAKREVSITQSRKTRTGLSYVTLPVDHVVYLIQKAERVNEVELQSSGLYGRICKINKDNNELWHENKRYKQLLESTYSIIQLSDLDEKEHPYGKSLKQIENLIIDSWEKEGASNA